MASKTYVDSSNLSYYDEKLKNHINNIVENDIGPAIDAKADNSVFGASGSNHSKGLVPDPGATSGTTKFLREDGTWSVIPNIITSSVSIATSDWSNNSCTKNVTGMTSTATVIVSAAPTSIEAYLSSGVRATAQGTVTLTFSCDSVPSSTITVNILLIK